MLGYILGAIVINSVPRKKASLFGMGISSALCLVLAVAILITTKKN